MASMSSALGGFGRGPTLTTRDGRVYEFTLDVPLVIAHVEEMCLEWARSKMAKKLAGLPDRHVPGTDDHAHAAALRAEYQREVDEDEYKARSVHRDEAGVARRGTLFDKFSRTDDGRLATIVASLRIKHPEADARLVQSLAVEYPDEVIPIIESVGNAAAAFATNTVRATARINPEAAARMAAEVTAAATRPS